MVIWVTGLSGAGKTTLCNALWHLLKPDMSELILLDGDAIRLAFSNDLGYSEEERIIQIKRLQNMAKVLSEQEMVVIVAALYSNPELFAWNKHNFEDYFEIYLDASLDTVRERNSKGLYSGNIINVVGLDIPWQAPESPDLVIDANEPDAPEILALQVVAAIPRLARVLEEARI